MKNNLELTYDQFLILLQVNSNCLVL